MNNGSVQLKNICYNRIFISDWERMRSGVSVVMLMMISLIWTLTKSWRGVEGSISEVLLIRQRLTHPPISGCSISVVIKRLFDGKLDGCFKLEKKIILCGYQIQWRKNQTIWFWEKLKEKTQKENILLQISYELFGRLWCKWIKKVLEIYQLDFFWRVVHFDLCMFYYCFACVVMLEQTV